MKGIKEIKEDNNKILRQISIVMNVLEGFLFPFYLLMTPLFSMATEAFLSPHTPIYETFVYAWIYIMVSNNVFILISIGISIYFRKKGKIVQSIIVQFVPILIILLGMAVALLGEPFREGRNEPYTKKYQKQIHETLPLYEFECIGYKNDLGYHTQTIRIKNAKERGMIQELPELDAWAKDSELGFTVEDMNFDGFGDLNMVRSGDGRGTIMLHCWLFDPATNQFEYSQELSDMPNLTVDQQLRQIVTMASCCGGQREVFYYQWIDGKIIPIKKILTGYADETNSGDFEITYEWIDGKWVETKRVANPLSG